MLPRLYGMLVAHQAAGCGPLAAGCGPLPTYIQNLID
jgi:hypothetical protein